MKSCRLQVSHLQILRLLKTCVENLTTILSMNLMILPNQRYLIVKLYLNCPFFLPDTHVGTILKAEKFCVEFLKNEDFNKSVRSFEKDKFIFLEKQRNLRTRCHTLSIRFMTGALRLTISAKLWKTTVMVG